jgi:hypothetical protein
MFAIALALFIGLVAVFLIAPIFLDHKRMNEDSENLYRSLKHGE